MDTLDKLFELQKSLSKDIAEVQMQLDSAKSPAAKLLLKTKHNVLSKLYQQVKDLVIPY